jgi:FkbM family methyltransferase
LGPRHAARLLGLYTGAVAFEPTTFAFGRQSVRCESAEDVATLVSIFLREDYGRIPPSSTVVDVGANVGLFCQWALHCDATHVHAYEPVKENWERLVKATSAAPVTSHLVAVADDDGERALAINSSATHTLLLDLYPSSPTTVVNCTTLDTVLDEVGPVDLLKIDIEGGEYKALYPSGMTSESVRSVRMEYHVGTGPDENPRALIDFFNARDFDIRHFLAISRNSGLLWADARRNS